MTQWYVIKTKAHCENSVENLFSKAKIKVFNPKLKELRYREQISYQKIASLFSGYIFLYINFHDPVNFKLVKYTRGVSKILCVGKHPLPIGKEIISLIQKRVNENGIIDVNTKFKRGEKIKVKRGLLKDLEGILEKPIKTEGRVAVLLKLINYNLKATLHWSEIEKMTI